MLKLFRAYRVTRGVRRSSRMASAIELFLYGDAANIVSADGGVGDYSLAEIRIDEESVRLRISSERLPYVFTWVCFGDVHCLSGGVGQVDPYDRLFPTEIHAFHSWEESWENRAGFWKFALQCQHATWSWFSKWPEVSAA